MRNPDIDLIERVYEAALVSDHWPRVLHDLALSINGFGTLLTIVSPSQRDRWVTSNAEMEELVRAHLQDFPDNSRTVRLLASRHPGFLVDRDVLSEQEMDAEPIYREFLRPRGFGHGTATKINAPSGDMIIFHIEARGHHGPVSSQAVASLDALRPHLARAALIANRLDMDRARNAVAALELAGLPAAVLLRTGRALEANLLFQKLIPAVVCDLPTRLKLMEPGADALFEEALAASSPAPAVRSIPMRANGDHPPMVFHLVPIHGQARDVFSRAHAILIATPLVPSQPLGAGLIEGLFDLTPAEAKLAALIAGNHPPRDAAKLLGWTEETARTTLKRVFAKTGVSRQTQLVALLGKL